jgi:hypothetical protein
MNLPFFTAQMHLLGLGWTGRCLRLASVAAFALVTGLCQAQTNRVLSGGAPPPPRRAPAPSAEVAALLERLIRLAASPRSEDQAELGRLLGESKTLDQLDAPAVRDRSRPRDLQLARVLDRLRENPSPNAAQSFATLTRNKGFNRSWLRSELLVRALATQRPLLPDSLSFLSAQAQPASVNLHLAIDSLCENNSEPAIAVVGRKLADPKIDYNYKIAWIRGPILERRRSPVLLAAAEKWLADGGLKQDLRAVLAEALFDYQPSVWYPGGEGLPRPPDEKATSAEAAAILRRIGTSVSNGDYPVPIQSAARRTLGDLP